jgi:hypothetical protein
LDYLSDGWFSFQTVFVLSYRDLQADRLYFWRSILAVMWLAIIAGMAYPAISLARAGSPAGTGHPPLISNLGLIGALLAASRYSSLVQGAYDNAFIPACAALALLIGLSFGRTQNWAKRHAWQPSAPWPAAGVLVLSLVQFGLLTYKPLEQLPSAEDRRAGEQFVAQLRELPGEVLVFNHGFVNYQAGKTTYYSSVPLGDVNAAVLTPRSAEHRRRIEFTPQLHRQAVQQQAFDWVIVDKPGAAWLPYYLPYDVVFDEPGVFYPVTGAVTRPKP